MTAKEAKLLTLWNKLPAFIQNEIKDNVNKQNLYAIVFNHKLDGMSKYDIEDIKYNLKMLGYVICENKGYFEIRW